MKSRKKEGKYINLYKLIQLINSSDGAPTALFKKEAEAAGLSGRAKAEFVSERSRAWNEAREDREIAKSSGRAAAGRAATELGIKVSVGGWQCALSEAGAPLAGRARCQISTREGGAVPRMCTTSLFLLMRSIDRLTSVA